MASKDMYGTTTEGHCKYTRSLIGSLDHAICHINGYFFSYEMDAPAECPEDRNQGSTRHPGTVDVTHKALNNRQLALGSYVYHNSSVQLMPILLGCMTRLSNFLLFLGALTIALQGIETSRLQSIQHARNE